MTFSSPVESNLSKQAVEKLAADFAEQMKFSPGDDLVPLVRRLGGKIVLRDISEFNDPSSGSIEIRVKGDFDIALPAHTGPTRDRFTIAHELGHYVLHYLWPLHRGQNVGSLKATRYGEGRVEWEANWFAAGLLMPSAAFRSEVERHGKDVAKLASIFGVSHMAVDVRLKSLNLK